MNLVEPLDSHARNRPSHSAVIDGERVFTYRDLHRLVLAAAARLAAAGVRQGDVVGVCLDHSVDHLVVLYALARLGAIILPVEVSFAMPERQRMIETFAARFVVSKESLDGIGDARPIRIDESWQAPSTTVVLPPMPTGPDQPLLFVLTSGTTAAPRATLRTHEHQWHRCLSYSIDSGVCALDRYLCVLGLGTNVGRNECLAQTVLGGTVVINRADTVPAVVDALERHKITWTFMLPAHLRQLVRRAAGPAPLLPRLRLLMTGTGPLNGAERRAVVERVSPRLSIQYGANDSGRFSTLPPHEVLTNPESAGRPHVGVDAQVVDDRHRLVPTGAVGLIRFRGPGFPTGYYQNPEATARSYRDGWFYPGDLAAIDDDGYIYLKGRADEVINFEGLKIYPSELEAVLLGHPMVIEAAVIAWPHGSEELPLGLVVAKDPFDAADLVAFARRRLAAHKVPSRILRLPELPKTVAGKIDKAALKQWLERFAQQRQQP